MTARTAPARDPSICLMLCTDPDRTGEAETCGAGSAEPGESQKGSADGSVAPEHSCQGAESLVSAELVAEGPGHS